MSDANRLLQRQFLEWLDERPRTREDVLDAWRTSCQRLSVWEDVCAEGLVECGPAGVLRPSAAGRHRLERR